MSVFDWILDFVQGKTRSDRIFKVLEAAAHNGELDQVWATLPAEDQADLLVLAHMPILRLVNSIYKSDVANPIDAMLGFALDQVTAHAASLEPATPDTARQKLIDEMKFMIKIMGEMHAAQKILMKVPWMNSPALDGVMRNVFISLGFGAVLNAVTHDNVKIAMLRPWQDNLEAVYRNKRPETPDILNAYTQRSLSETVITNINEITDPVMDQIEDENKTSLYKYLAVHGYKDEYIGILADAATKALTFGNLSSMARMGHYDRQLAIFSLWTYGLDRRLMVASLNALETMRDVGLYKGFRSMVEPGYVQGLIEASDVRSYWSKILVPQDVQDWAMVRLTAARERFAAKEAKTIGAASRDLTRADFKAAYLDGIIDLATYETKLKALGYDDQEIDVIVKLTEASRKTAAASKCKRLPLSDYELAHRNGILTLQQVLDRMKDEYCPDDIALEKQLLEIADLTSEAPAKERDLSVSQITQVYVDGDITKPELDTYLEKLGFDEQERTWLLDLTDVKKAAADAKANSSGGKAAVIKDRDLTRSDFTFEYVHNRITEEEYRAAMVQLRYDQKEIDMIVDIANVKKKIPSIEGLKHLPLTDYEKMYKKGFITLDDVLNSMKGTYAEADIQLERLGLIEGVL